MKKFYVLMLYSASVAALTPVNFILAMLSYWLPDPFKFCFGAMFCVLGMAWAVLVIATFAEVHDLARKEAGK